MQPQGGALIQLNRINEMKRIILILCAVLGVMVSGRIAVAQEADELITVVKINKTDGSVLRYGLPSVPEIAFSGDNLVVTAAEVADLEIPRSEVAHIDFEKTRPNNLEAVTLGEGDLTFSFNGEEVVVAARRLTRVELFDIAGHKLVTVAAEDGNARVSLASLAPGIYVVVPDSHPAVKVVKK